MMKQNLQFVYGALAVLALAGCSNNDDVNEELTQSNGYATTIEVSANTQQSTRALKLDANKNVTATWEKGDKMFVYNLSDNDQSTATAYSLVTMNTTSADKKTADFTGNIISRLPMKASDKLAFFYPGNAIEGDKTVEPVDPDVKTESQQGVTISYHEPINKIKSTVALNMKLQDGKLATIDKKFDYNWGVTLPGALDNNGTQAKVTKTNVALQRKVAFWGMKFILSTCPSSKGPIEDIDSVKINGLRSYDVLNLNNGTFVGTEDEKEHVITIANKDKSKLNLDGGYLWVAFLPENAPTNFHITVYTPNGVFTKEATKDFKEGYDYRSNINVKIIEQHPYVEVNGVKWATGNFIHYKTCREEYWGIAPAQWWISSYGENPRNENKAGAEAIKYNGLGSQNWFVGSHIGRFSQTTNDCDLFQWGVIRDALKFNGVYYLQGTQVDLQGKYYKERGGLVHVNEVSGRRCATHGDIVRYYTEAGQKHYHYQYPSKANFDALCKANTIIPGYCYTDKGNKIYGAFFSDMKLAGKGSKFPTGRKLWKYQDVSGLVLANKGLFLPIAGRRPINSAWVEFRHVAFDSGFYGQYYSSYCTTYSIPNALFYGAAFKVNVAVASKDQGASIRPVYVGADNNDEAKPIDAANFAPFRNIVSPMGRKY